MISSEASMVPLDSWNNTDNTKTHIEVLLYPESVICKERLTA